jgi:PKD repeat protein
MMMKMGSRTRPSIAVLALAVSVLTVGCALDDADIPPLTGPSGLALSVIATATPDRLPRDGTSQSVIALNVRDAQNRPAAGQRLTLTATPTAARLSVSEVVTDANGQATFTLTAPPAGAIAGDVVTILATPVGDTSGGAAPRTIEVQLSGAANTTNPTFPAEAAFTVTPASPEVGQVTSFDASGTRDEGVPCLDACSYRWTFGTEAVRTGRVQTHAFATPGIHSVSLTVTDAAGGSATAQRNVTVTAAARPTITTVTVTPAAPVAGQSASFTAGFTVAPNHRIVSFRWQWGDGTTTTTSDASTTHAFSANGTYVVTVTATDDLGQSATTTVTVVVGSGVVASFRFSPTDPKQNDTVVFDGSASSSTAGATIVKWTWNFGDGSATEESDEPIIEHDFPNDRTYVVRLTVTDSAGRTATTTQDVTIDEP